MRRQGDCRGLHLRKPTRKVPRLPLSRANQRAEFVRLMKVEIGDIKNDMQDMCLSALVCLPEHGVHASVKIVSAYIILISTLTQFLPWGHMNKTNAFNRTPVAQAISLILGSTLLTPALAQEANSSPEDVGEIVVTGIRASLESSMNLKRAGQGVVDGIVAEDIGKFPDTNLAESLQRISGVSINRTASGEGQQITVRGVGPDFNLILLNGRQMPASNLGRGGAGTTNSRAYDFSNHRVRSGIGDRGVQDLPCRDTHGRHRRNVEHQDRASAGQARPRCQFWRQGRLRSFGAPTCPAVIRATTSRLRCRPSSATPSPTTSSASARARATRSAIRDSARPPWRTAGRR